SDSVSSQEFFDLEKQIVDEWPWDVLQARDAIDQVNRLLRQRNGDAVVKPEFIWTVCSKALFGLRQHIRRYIKVYDPSSRNAEPRERGVSRLHDPATATADF